MMAGILRDVKVLDLSRTAAGAYATMMLSDQGAQVTRVIENETDLHREGGFLIWDRGKACVQVNLSGIVANQDGMDRFQKLLAATDIVVDDFAPSDPRQALIREEVLIQINPKLIACSITAYGKEGPLRDEAAIDDLVLARMGVLSGMPGFRPAPVHLIHPLPSVGAALFACLGIAAALLEREASGKGRTVETSLMAGALLYHPKVIGAQLADHVFQTHPSGSAPFYSVYECGDGKWVQLGCVHPGFVAKAAEVIGIAEIAAEPRFQGGGQTPEDELELRSILTSALKEKDYADWAIAFEAADVPFAPSQLTEDALTDPQVRHNEMLLSLSDPVRGTVQQMGVPIKFSQTPGSIQGPRTPNLTDLDSLLETNSKPIDPTAEATATGRNGGINVSKALPLSGMRVLEVSNLIAGPTGGRLLADLGADVIKLEPHGGDLSRPIGRTYFYNLNYNKRSISVDTSNEAGKALVAKIAHSADAMLANLRPGATARMGIGPDTHPRLIEAHITGYGATGPYARRPGIDPLAQATMGLEWAQGGFGNAPVFPAQLAPTDYTTGATAAFAIVLALYARHRFGAIERIDCNLLNGAIMLSSPWFSQYDGKPTRALADAEQYGLNPFHRLYPVKDGWIYIAADTEQEQRNLAALLDAPYEVTGQGDRRANDHPLNQEYARRLATTVESWNKEAILDALRQSNIPAIEVYPGDSAYFLEDPHTEANGMKSSSHHPTVGELTVACNYITLKGCETGSLRPTPLLGEQNEEVLRDIGYTDLEIEALYQSNVLKTDSA